MAETPRSGGPPQVDGPQRAAVTALACTPAPVGYSRWTLHLLADKAVKLALVEAISHESVRQVLKNELQPHRQQHWCLGAMNAAFMARMEDVLAVHKRPHDPRSPVVCFDERPCVLHGQPTEPLLPVPVQPAQGEQPVKAGRSQRESSTYVRQGTACLLAAFEPGMGQRLVEVLARRTGADYCRFMQRLAAHYPQAEKIVFVQDNLNTHTDAVFYQHLPAVEARGLSRLDSRCTTRPKRFLAQHGRVGTLGQYLHQCIPTLEDLTAHIAACVAGRNAARVTVKWQFTWSKPASNLTATIRKLG